MKNTENNQTASDSDLPVSSGYKIDIIKMLLSSTTEIHGNKVNAGRAYLVGCLSGLQETTAIEIEKNFRTLIL